jgi:hypothetical protein
VDPQHAPFRYSYFQLTFGQEEAYLRPQVTYERLRRCGYDAIEVCPPKGRYGLGVSMEDYLATHLRLKADFGLDGPLRGGWHHVPEALRTAGCIPAERGVPERLRHPWPCVDPGDPR